MNLSDVAGAVREGGSLLILAFVVFWITKGLNGKLDRLTGAIHSLEKALISVLDSEEDAR